MSDNWVVQNLENALETWNEKLSEIWTLITTTPQNFKGGNIWKVIVDINGAVQAIGLALLVLFFVIGMVKTCGSFTDVKKPEHALKLFVRFALAKGVITYGMELMLALFNIVQGTISTIMNAAGFGTPEQTTLPAEMITTIEDCGFFEKYSLVGGNAYRRIIYHGAVVYSDNDSVWTIFQVVYVHSTCTDTAFHICRRTYTECRQEFYQELLCSSA